MEIQPGLFVHDATSLRLALEHMQQTLPPEDWRILQREIRRIGLRMPSRTRKETNQFVTFHQVLSEKELGAIWSDSCAICCDNHTKKDGLITSCGHCFGTECFKKWADVRKSNNLNTVCPLCKSKVKHVTQYR